MKSNRNSDSRLGSGLGWLVLSRCAAAVAGCRQDMHNQPKYRPLRASAFFAERRRARGRSSRARSRAARCRTTRRSSPARSAATLVNELPFAVDAGRSSIAASSASTSTARRATTRPATATAWSCSAAIRSRRRIHIDRLRQRRGRLLLRRDDQRLRRDAGLQGADHAARSLGHRRLHPRAAAQPARDRRRTSRAAIRRSCRSRAGASGTAAHEPARALSMTRSG